MGIPGLLQHLKSYTQAGNIGDFRGQAIAVDASSWLHKSVYSIAEHYVEATWGNGSNESTSSSNPSADARSVQVSTDYMMKRCTELLQHAGIARIYLVFDGERCPLKAGTNAERENKRKEHLRQARYYKQLASQASGNNKHKYREKMFNHYKTCIKVTNALADAVADKLQQEISRHNSRNNNSNNDAAARMELVFSPYEADSQLVQLCLAGLTQAVVTEDSDVLVYSAACQVAFPILFKLDGQTGCCQILSMDFLLNSSNGRALKDEPPKRRSALLPLTNEERAELEKKSKGGNNSNNNNSQLENILSCFAERQKREPGRGSRLFVQGCILAGCDYAPNLLDGVGLVTAFKQVRSCMHRSADDRFRQVLKLLPHKNKRGILQQQGTTTTSSSLSPMEAYEQLLAKSEAVFYYHPVLDTVARRISFLHPPNTAAVSTSRKQKSDINNSDGGGGGHRPSLARYQGDWSFLSNPQHGAELQSSLSHHNSGGEDTSTWFARRPSSSNKPQHESSLTSSSRQQQQPLRPTRKPAPPAQPPSHHQSSSSAAVPAFVAMSNPYRRKTTHKKRSAQEDANHAEKRPPEKRSKRGPLAPKSPNDQQAHSSKNRFAMFAHNKDKKPQGKENPPPENEQKRRNLQALFKNRKKGDVRFVKPVFNKDGSRLEQQQQPPPTATTAVSLPFHDAQAAAPSLPPPSFDCDESSGQEQMQQQSSFFSTTSRRPSQSHELEHAFQDHRAHGPSRQQQQQSFGLSFEAHGDSSRRERHDTQPDAWEQGDNETDSKVQAPPQLFSALDDDEVSDYGSRGQSLQRQPPPPFFDPGCSREEESSLPFVSSEDEQIDSQPHAASALAPPNLPFGSDDDEVEDDNIAGLAATAPFRNPSFCNGDTTPQDSFLSRPTGLPFGEGQNDPVNNDFVDLTEGSCPPPFDDPSEPTRSDYFSRPRLGSGYARRVTLDSPTQNTGRSSTAAAAAGRLQKNPMFQPDLPRPNQFDLYDEFLSPNKAPSADEDIEDSPADSGNHHGMMALSFNMSSQQSHHHPPPKPKSSIGPAKTLRNRFKSCGKVNNKKNTLAKAFERQRKIAAFEGTSSQQRGHASQQSRRRRVPEKNQSTLVFHFSSTAKK